jgi:hypothetical protein
MADDEEQGGARARRRHIDPEQYQALRDWANRFGVTRERLKEAIRAVGNDARKVEAHLKEATRRPSGKGGGEHPG